MGLSAPGPRPAAGFVILIAAFVKRPRKALLDNVLPSTITALRPEHRAGLVPINSKLSNFDQTFSIQKATIGNMTGLADGVPMK